MHSTNLKLQVILTAVLLVLTTSKLSEGTSALSPESYSKSFGEQSNDEWFELQSESESNSNSQFSSSQFINSQSPSQFTAEGNAAGIDSLIYENDSVFTIDGVRDELQNDGEWIKVSPAEIDPEGVTDGNGGFDDEINTEYVWRPYNVEPGWTPYSNGYWRYSNCGWMWTSYYSWGWRPYHYGRWWWSAVWGWVWSPGFVFAPAWVVWMYDDDYCGWYPISPRVRCGGYYNGYYNNYYACNNMRYRVRCWTFVYKPKFCDPITPVIIGDPGYNNEIIKRCTYNGKVSITNDRVVNNGPDMKGYRKVNRRKVPS